MPDKYSAHIKRTEELISPHDLRKALPVNETTQNFITSQRQQAADIIQGRDKRLLVLVGPCSIHDPKAALDYAERLKTCMQEHKSELCLMMRAYFEKPRTRLGWSGLLSDPERNASYQVNQGLHTARQLLIDINQLGVPTGSEFLDTLVPHYLADLTSWSAIGARTAESQLHRQLASGLSTPVGFKNSTAGHINIAVDAVFTAKQPHHFLGINQDGMAAIHHTTGNPDGHIILRGSTTSTNFDAVSIANATHQLKESQLAPRLMVDCSHGNSAKDHTKQGIVVNAIAEQISDGSQAIFGAMLESNLVGGRQEDDGKTLAYGQSITDACIDWDTTQAALDTLANAVKRRGKLAAAANGTGQSSAV